MFFEKFEEKKFHINSVVERLLSTTFVSNNSISVNQMQFKKRKLCFVLIDFTNVGILPEIKIECGKIRQRQPRRDRDKKRFQFEALLF